jgi:secreted PhoX family phosphatase
VQVEQDAVGNSFLHVRRNRYGVWEVVNGSPYNRRVYGDRPEFDFTGPRAGDTSGPVIGATANGSVGDCSGGITPWHTALACEENFAGYGEDAAEGGYGWAQNGDSTYAPDAEYDPVAYAKVRLGVRARPLRPAGATAQAHGARPLPAREHRLPS